MLRAKNRWFLSLWFKSNISKDFYINLLQISHRTGQFLTRDHSLNNLGIKAKLHNYAKYEWSGPCGSKGEDFQRFSI